MPHYYQPMPSNGPHFLIVPVCAWGHTKPACQLALRLLEHDENITVTIIAVPSLLARARSEITDHIAGGTIDKSSRVRVLTRFDSVEKDVFKIIAPLVESYPAAYKTLLEEKPITCATTGMVYDPAPAPTAAIVDFFLAPLIHMTRAATGNSVPVFNWATGSPHGMLRNWAPESLGGQASLFDRVSEEVGRTGGDEDDIGTKMYKQTVGTVVRVPGLPPMYDHEFLPQEWSMPTYRLLKAANEVFKTCDGVILSASSVVDAGAIEGLKTWLGNKPVYSVGPLLPRTYWDPVKRDGDGDDSDETAKFLSYALDKYGERSVVLISFGTFFWPPKQEYIEEVITALIEKGVPFILAHPSSFAAIPDELSEKIKSSGLGMCSSWVPQQYVLSHPATGWFLTHGGQGSVTEALGSGIPLIFWPIEADQPGIAANVSQNLRAAFELVEVRTGPGLQGGVYKLGGRKPQGTREAVGREIREVIDAARGEVGREMRRTVLEIKTLLRDSWNDGGAAKKDLGEFVKKIAEMKAEA